MSLHLDGKRIAVWFSCGAASAVASKLTLGLYSQNNEVVIVNNPIAEEHQDNLRFLRDCESWLGVKIQSAVSSKYPSQSCVDVWENRKFMSGPTGAPCTLELKKKPRQEWEAVHKPDYTVLGFTYEETERADRFKLTERDTLLTPLIDARLSKEACFRILKAAGIKLPDIYEMGYPNANCIGCVKASSSTYWNHVRKQHPEVFQKRAEQSKKLGARLVYYKGKRLFLDELPKDAKGRSLKKYNFECGLFCEEKLLSG